MTALTRWNPFEEMEALQDRLSTIFNGAAVRSNNAQTTWLPLMDVWESENDYFAKADLPGVRKEDLQVTLEQGVLTIAGERKHAVENDVDYLTQERPVGRFVRSIALPSDADPNQIHAAFRDGVLNIRVAKHPEAKPKQIEIQSE